MAKRTLVLGASDHKYRYSYMALQRLKAAGHEVFALGAHEAWVGDIPITTKAGDWAAIDTVTVYLSAKNQQGYYDYLLALRPKRVIFNPGAENEVLAKKLKQEGIEVLEACTLVMLSTGQY
jgi:uncharacterized protein